MRRLAERWAAQVSTGRGSRRATNRSAAALLGSALAVCLLAMVAAAPAFAADYSFKRIGEFGTSPGSGPGEFDQVRRLAVEASTGNVFVVDQDNDRVQVLEPQGSSLAFLTQFGPGTLDQPFGIAIREAAGQTHVYVSDAGNGRIVEFESDGADPPSFSVEGSFTSPAVGSGPGQVGDFAAPLAIDPTNGDLLVADKSDNRIERYGADGVFKSSFDGSSSPGGAFAGLADLAVEADGDILVADATGPIYIAGENPNAPSRVERFDPAGAHLATIVPLGLTGNGLVAADHIHDEVSVGDIAPGIAISIFNQSGRIASFDLGGLRFGTMTGLGFDGGLSGRLYASAETSPFAGVQHSVAIYEPAVLPTVAIDPVNPTTVSDSEAALSGSVNPEGVSTSWHFEIRRAGDSSWSSLAGSGAGGGTGAVPVQFQVTGLEPNTSYEARLVGESSSGPSQTAPVTFATAALAPEAVTRFVAPRTTTTARLNGLVNSGNANTTYFFEYGTTVGYGARVPVATGASAPSGNRQLLVSEEVTGLQPATTYHYRIVAVNQAGRVDGEDATFTTRSPAEAGPPKRGIELANRPDKGNQDIETLALSGDGDKVIWAVPGGAPGTSTGTLGSLLAERTPTGWQSKSLLPPVDRLFGGASLNLMLAEPSADYSRSVFMATSGFFSRNAKYFVTIDRAGNQFVSTPIPGSYGPTYSSFQSAVSPSADLGHLYVTTDMPIDPHHEPGTHQVYDFATVPPTLMSRMPGTGQPPACGVTSPGSSFEPGAVKLEGDQAVDFFHSRGDNCSGPWQLYVRDPSKPEAELISGPALSGTEGSAWFIRANRTGSRALYVTPSRLDPGDSNNDPDIYQWTRGSGNKCLSCVLPDVNVHQSAGNAYKIVASKDLSHVYFVSKNLLEPGVGNAGDEKLYVLHDGSIRYIASVGTSPILFPDRTGALSDDGSVLLFQVDESGVTTDDNGGYTQLYRYDDSDRSVECLSCRRGALSKAGAFGPSLFFPGTRQVTVDGSSAVFRTTERLLPADINGGNDIYEWKGGALSLVTDGETVYAAGSGELRLNGMSDDGRSILFTAGANLTGYEVDRTAQAYVARVGGGFPPPATPPAPCSEDSCQGPLAAPPPPLVPGSAELRGAGNQAGAPARPGAKKCGKGKVRRKVRMSRNGKARRKAKCVKRSKGKRHAARAKHHRRAAR